MVCLSAILFLIQSLGGGPCLAQTLREEADRLGILVGAAVDPGHFGEASYTAALTRDFNMVEPENAMKWTIIRPDQGSFKFGPGDQVVTYAQAHHMKVRGHNLLWARKPTPTTSFDPDWIDRGHFTPQQLSEILHDHITKVVKHFAGKVYAWDVVNEAFDAHGHLEHSHWYDTPGIGLAMQGTAYIEQAFRWARAADPHALLFYNDFDAEGLNPKSDAIYAMVKDFKQRGVPIDGVGLQAHLDLNSRDYQTLGANMARFVSLGVQVQVTEMDVGIPVDRIGNATSPVDLCTQANIYREVAAACLQQPGCTAFQTWGFTDRYTWYLTLPPPITTAMPLLFDRDYAPKAAYQAVLDAFYYTRGRRGAVSSRR
jgi:endo-1,4-beta-xylanase